MTKQERIEAFNEKWRVLSLKIVNNEKGRCTLDREIGLGLYIAIIPSWIKALTEAKAIMEMEEDE